MYHLFFSAAVLSICLTGPLFFLLRQISARQVEREEGPASHKIKSGTPTMGGIGFLASILAFSLIFVDFKYFPILFLALGFALIGLSDDLIKIAKKQNLGLTFRQKIVLQLFISGMFAAYLMRSGLISGDYPFIISCFLFWIFIIVGTANAANLTDGLDGLLGGCSVIAFISFGLICWKQGFFGGMALSFISSGAVFGFLPFNFPKAKLFMGDVGSLSIGAILSGLAIITGNEWLLLPVGGVFAAEALSVIIQVTSFKLFKKRVFKMSPLHHHFELLGIKEAYVAMGFWFCQLILGIFGVILA